MFAEIIILTIMGLVLLAWVIFCGIQFIHHGRDVVAGADFIGHVKCEKCGTEYEVSAEEFTKSYMSKYRSVTRTKIQGGASVNRPQYSYYAKKFHSVNRPQYSYYAKKFQCPCCGKKRYAQVLNINEINQMMTRPVLRAGIRWLILMGIGGVLILAVASIPLHFADRAREQRVEELREQQYEDFKERYGL